jgi:hypothetical protein
MILRRCSQNEQKHKATIWESRWGSQQDEKKEYAVECQQDNQLTRLPALKGKSNMSVISANRCYEWDNSCRCECYWVTVP